jgi:hypothetical protein
MVLYTAGQRIRGSEINALPQLYRVATDQSNNTISYVNCTGLSFPADINGWYLIECFLFYMAHSAADMLCRWQFPTGTAGWWAADGIEAGQTTPIPSVGTVNRQSTLFATPGEHGFAGSSGAPTDTFAKPAATIQIGANAGTVQLQYRQFNVNSGNPTIIRAGSCIRVSRIA